MIGPYIAAIHQDLIGKICIIHPAIIEMVDGLNPDQSHNYYPACMNQKYFGDYLIFSEYEPYLLKGIWMFFVKEIYGKKRHISDRHKYSGNLNSYPLDALIICTASDLTEEIKKWECSDFTLDEFIASKKRHR